MGIVAQDLAGRCSELDILRRRSVLAGWSVRAGAAAEPFSVAVDQQYAGFRLQGPYRLVRFLRIVEPGVTVGSCGFLPWRCPGSRELTTLEGFDDPHRAAAFRARRKLIRFISTGGCLFFGHLIRLCLTAEQAPDHRDPVPTDAVGEEASMTDAVEA